MSDGRSDFPLLLFSLLCPSSQVNSTQFLFISSWTELTEQDEQNSKRSQDTMGGSIDFSFHSCSVERSARKEQRHSFLKVDNEGARRHNSLCFALSLFMTPNYVHPPPPSWSSSSSLFRFVHLLFPSSVTGKNGTPRLDLAQLGGRCHSRQKEMQLAYHYEIWLLHSFLPFKWHIATNRTVKEEACFECY